MSDTSATAYVSAKFSKYTILPSEAFSFNSDYYLPKYCITMHEYFAITLRIFKLYLLGENDPLKSD